MNNQTSHFDLAIVIPCYNEENRLPLSSFENFIQQNKECLIYFVNDGSSDNTIKVLQKFKNTFSENVDFLDLEENLGKAGAVREGFLTAQQKFQFDKIAYLDADLSTSLEECKTLSKEIKDETVFVFGSRISKTDNNIDRKFYRFLIGRFIATLISNQLKLKVYDTQCGCKIFDSKISNNLFQEEFISKWLFDVEIFHRLIAQFGIEKIKNIAKEVPLNAWVDTEDSRVKFTYFFKLWFDLYAIGRKYKK